MELAVNIRFPTRSGRPAATVAAPYLVLSVALRIRTSTLPVAHTRWNSVEGYIWHTARYYPLPRTALGLPSLVSPFSIVGTPRAEIVFWNPGSSLLLCQ